MPKSVPAKFGPKCQNRSLPNLVPSAKIGPPPYPKWKRNGPYKTPAGVWSLTCSKRSKAALR